ncbi:uncharacterized protein LOC129217646 [Uloborus diversus]|uniref:uncharacterized protein LOC129217646 n=1 Tax=Uloborus diversus TaxID=327109 RepID=UPI002408F46D|nr:uncharacterized protein LOC129217646 [Uloborus diversus]
MNKILRLTSLFSVLTLSLCALAPNNRYAGPPHSRNSLGHRAGPPSYGSPVYAPHSSPVAPPQHYGGARHYGNSAHSAPRHSGPVNYGPAPRYGAPSHGAPAPHYGGLHQRSAPAYQPHLEQPRSYSAPAPYRQQPESQPQVNGREMKYTIRDPHNRGTTHVTETHVVSNRQMHGAEAEAAMKKLMGSMGPASYGSDSSFQNFVKDMGLPFY